MTAFPEHWARIAFDRAFVDVTGGNVKIQTSDYAQTGRFPIIDQGRDFIAGYINDAGARCKVDGPCILFGDHTKSIKYVDFPFALGADGVKVLKPSAVLDSRFAYWFLMQARLPDDVGYSRHFKFLKRLEVPLPPIDEQSRIAAILDKTDCIRRKRQETLALTEQLLRSTFLEMFGDPVLNPKGWATVELGQLGVLDRGRSQHRPRNDPSLLGGAHPLIQTGDVANSGGVIRRFQQSYSDLGLLQSRKWPTGTLCITIAANIAQTGILAFDACFPDSVVGFTPGPRVASEYVQGCLMFLQPILEAKADQVAQKNINLEVLRKLEIPVPDVTRVSHFADSVRGLRHHQLRLEQALDDADALFASLTHRAFTGQL